MSEEKPFQDLIDEIDAWCNSREAKGVRWAHNQDVYILRKVDMPVLLKKATDAQAEAQELVEWAILYYPRQSLWPSAPAGFEFKVFKIEGSQDQESSRKTAEPRALDMPSPATLPRGFYLAMRKGRGKEEGTREEGKKEDRLQR